MPGGVGGRPVRSDSQVATIHERDLLARHIQIDRQQAAGAHQEVVREDRVDDADRPPIAADQSISAFGRRNANRLVHAATVADAGTATLTAPGRNETSTGTLPNGSPSRCTRVPLSPSMSTERACTISTLGFLTWSAL